MKGDIISGETRTKKVRLYQLLYKRKKLACYATYVDNKIENRIKIWDPTREMHLVYYMPEAALESFGGAVAT